MVEPAAMVSVTNLRLHVGSFSLHDVSLTVPPGEYLCIVGPTGSGKTLLLETIAGLHHPESGRVLVGGVDVTSSPPQARGLGYVPQDYALFPHMSVSDNIAYGLVERGVARTERLERVQGMAEWLGILHLLERRPGTLSGGERQRVALARALVLQCQILLLDEPFSAVDQLTRRGIIADLRRLVAELGLTVLHVTHDFQETHALASWVGVMHGGRLLQVGPLEEVFLRPASRRAAEFTGMANVLPLSRLLDTPWLRPLLDRLHDLPPHGDGYAVCIRPDAVAISRDGDLGAEATVTAEVSQMRWEGLAYEVELDAGVPLVAALTAREVARLGLRAGDRVQIGLSQDAVHVVPGD
ncbi:MAG: ATP-binding cassette domain-containing protein [Armatimonadetes bacterium]|nr:ATP-binding cassette domain-containing protein [Armatimonadota bacterium]